MQHRAERHPSSTPLSPVYNYWVSLASRQHMKDVPWRKQHRGYLFKLVAMQHSKAVPWSKQI